MSKKENGNTGKSSYVKQVPLNDGLANSDMNFNRQCPSGSNKSIHISQSQMTPPRPVRGDVHKK